MKKNRFIKPLDPLDDDHYAPEDAGASPSLSKKTRLLIGVGAAMLICALAVALPALLEAITPPAEAQAPGVSEQPQGSAAAAANSELSITAYADEWKETALQPNVSIELNEYSPAQSDVPGLPFIISAGSDALNPDSIRINVDAGSLITWEPPDYSVKQRGKTYVLSSGDTIYWSPIDAQGTAVLKCEMTVTGFDKDNNAYTVSALISQTSDFNYTAEIK